MSLIVQKYGGSSLSTPLRIREMASRISKRKKQGDDLVVVVSAMGNETDKLLKLAHEVSQNPPARELDMLLSVGERISMSLLSMALHDLGEPAISFTGSQSGIVTDAVHTNARILEVKADRIKEELRLGKVVIVAGFQGVSVDREITTLGRGGSDVTAVALAISLEASFCEFYKDVDGLYSKDPRQFLDAQKMSECDYSEVYELVEKGAKVFHPLAIDLAKKHALPLYLASSFNSEPGTWILPKGRILPETRSNG
ncbi:MAG: aspartate kinase [Deltaproteobacteria bacterium]